MIPPIFAPLLNVAGAGAVATGAAGSKLLRETVLDEEDEDMLKQAAMMAAGGPPGMQQGGEVFDMVAGQDEFSWDDPQNPNFQLPPEIVDTKNPNLQLAQDALMAAGLVPGVGNMADIANVGVSLGAGDIEGARDALIAAIPFIGLGTGSYKTVKSLKRALKSGPLKRQLNKIIDNITPNKKVKADLKGKITKTFNNDKIVQGIKDRNKKGIENILKENELPASRLRRKAKYESEKGWKITDPGVAPWIKSPNWTRTTPGIKQVPQPGRTWGETFQDIKQLAPIAAGVGAGAAILDHVLDSNAASTNQPTLTPEERERAVIDQTERTTRESMMQKFIEGGGY